MCSSECRLRRVIESAFAKRAPAGVHRVTLGGEFFAPNEAAARVDSRKFSWNDAENS
jgi:hypothetical protein